MNLETIINWMNNETMRNSVYHDHKENVMWAGFALYLSGFGALTLWLNGENVEVVNKAGWIVGIIFTTLITIIFILWQFNNRNIAGNKVETLISEETKLLRSERQFSWEDWEFDTYLKLPKFIAEKVPRGIRADKLIFNLALLLLPIIVACTVLILIVCNK
jgi:hypothetical protein